MIPVKLHELQGDFSETTRIGGAFPWTEKGEEEAEEDSGETARIGGGFQQLELIGFYTREKGEEEAEEIESNPWRRHGDQLWVTNLWLAMGHKVTPGHFFFKNIIIIIINL